MNQKDLCVRGVCRLSNANTAQSAREMRFKCDDLSMYDVKKQLTAMTLTLRNVAVLDTKASAKQRVFLQGALCASHLFCFAFLAFMDLLY